MRRAWKAPDVYMGRKASIGELGWMPWAVSGAYSVGLSPLVKGLHGYAGRRPAGYPMGAADRACRRTVLTRRRRASRENDMLSVAFDNPAGLTDRAVQGPE